MKTAVLSVTLLLFTFGIQAQKPEIAYTSPSTFTAGTSINPLTPVNTGGEVPNLGDQVSTLAGSTTYGFVNGQGTNARFYYPSGVAVDKSGNLFVTDKYNHVIRKITPTGDVTTFAGSGIIGSADGQGTSASFYYPGAVVIDGNENLFISDQLNMKIRKISKTGLVTTYAGDGVEDSDDGPAATASFRRPEGLALDADGNLYVAEFWGHKIRKITPAGIVSTLAGNGSAGSIDGQGVSAGFNWPCSITIDASGNLYVADQVGHKIRRVTPSGQVTTVAGTGVLGSLDGPAATATFNSPSAVLLDASGNILVADRSNNKIRRITPDGNVSTMAGSGTQGATDGASETASFNMPFALCWDANGNLIVADRYNHEIRKVSNSSYTIKPALTNGLKFDSRTGTISGTPIVGQSATTYWIVAKNASGMDTTSLTITVLGAPSIQTKEVTSIDATNAKCTGNLINLGAPSPTSYGFCWNLTGNPTTDDSKVKLDTASVSGVYTMTLSNLSPKTNYHVRAFASNAQGTVYGAELAFTTLGLKPDITYQATNTFSIGVAIAPLVPVNAGGPAQVSLPIVSTLSGSATSGFVNGPVASARFNNPTSVAVDKAGNIFVADKYNHVIRKITPAGEVSTFAGSGSIGSADGQGTTASFYYPAEVVVDKYDNVIVTDQYNDKIRKITKDGLVSTIAGSGYQGSSDGAATSATFYYPEGLVVDTVGNIYVSDLYNHKIRKITPAGVVSTLAGAGYYGSTDATGTSATFYYPSGLCLDASGSILVADQWNNKIRKVTTSGVVTTFAGSGSATSVDGTLSTATFNYPSGIVKDASGNLFVTERTGNRIRKISKDGQVTLIAGGASTGSVDGISDAARFNNPFGLALDLNEDIIVADRSNHEIRKVTMSAFTISPALPIGLKMDARTGVISGTPQSNLPTSTYLITARNESGIDSTFLAMTILGKASIATSAVSNIGSNAAKLNGTILSIGTPAAHSYGFCWNKTGNPTINDQLSKKDSIPSAGPFSFKIEGLDPGTKYYFKAFATNDQGTSYGDVIAFTTLDQLPKITYPTPLTLTEGVKMDTIKPTNTGGVVKNAMPIVSTVTGSGVAGFVNGNLTTATLNNPAGVAVDKSGNTFIADKYNHVIRKISTTGEVSTFAGSGSIGSADGQGVASSFYYPSAVAVDANDNLYVSDQYNYKIRKISQTGLVTTLAGSGWEGSSDGQGSSASFYYPEGLVVDTAGNVYVTDYYNHKIRKITATGLVTTLAGNGSAGSTDGKGSSASFNYPCGICLGDSGSLIVTDQHSCKIRQVSATGVVTTIAGSGAASSVDGPALTATTYYPSGVVRDVSGNLYFTERFGNRIRKMTLDGRVLTLVGKDTIGSTDGMYEAAKFNGPFGIALDLDGNLIVADRYNHKIRKISLTGFSIQPTLPVGLKFDSMTGAISGLPQYGSSTKTYTITATNNVGTASTELTLTVNGKSTVTTNDVSAIVTTSATLNANMTNTGVPAPTSYGFCWNRKGMPSLNDSVVWKALPAVVGSYSASLKNLSPGATYYVRAFSTNTFGTAYGAERSFTTPMVPPVYTYMSPQTYTAGSAIAPLIPIRSGGNPLPFPYVFTLAGNFLSSSINGTGSAASISYPSAIAIDASGTLYVTDANHLIRKITSDGVVTTLAGTGVAGSTDGAAMEASFYSPRGIAVDNKGNVYVADTYNNKIRKISKDGVVTTLAGSGTSGRTNGVGMAARFSFPSGLAVDTAGNVYVADKNNRRICKITPDGTVTTLAVNEPTGMGDSVGGTITDFNQPTGVAVDSMGNVFVADYGRNAIYKYQPDGSIRIIAGTGNTGGLDGPGLSATFYLPIGIGLDRNGNLFVTEYGGCRIRKISTDGVVSTLAGNSGNSGSLDGKANVARFAYPSGIALNSEGVAYVADYGNNLIRKIGSGNFSISPTLPAGLSFDCLTGVISGKPTFSSPLTTYTVYCYNTGGSCNATFDMVTLSSPDALPSTRSEQITFLPNPASDQIRFNGLMDSQNMTIYGLTGVKWLTKDVRNGESVNIGVLPAGIYVVKVGDQELKLVKK